MDKKTALTILNLDTTVSFSKAKTAYRNLAKRYHPDFLENTPEKKCDAEAKMKEINIAFRFLTPLLRADETIKKPPDKNREKESVTDTAIKKSITAVILAFFSKIFSVLPRPGQKKKTRPVETKPENGRSIQPPGGKTVLFEDVFRRIYSADSGGEKRIKEIKKRKQTQKKSPYKEYQRYMALKRKMKSGGFNSNPNTGIGKIDKITPVKPVERN